MDTPASSNPEHGFWLNFNPHPSETVHEFCGANEVQGGVCPNCAKPLLRILSPSTSDPRLNVEPSRTHVIHLLYCWTCSIPFGVFSYRLMEDSSVQILEVPPTYEYAFGAEGPYQGYTGTFPLRTVGLVQLTDSEHQRQLAAQSDTDLALGLSPQNHQIGGFPVIANAQEIKCPVCSHRSPLLAVISDSASAKSASTDGISPQETFTGNMGTQMVFHFCRSCSVVSAYHSND